MKAHKFFGSSRLILIALLLLGGLTASAVTYADSILPSFGIVSEGSFFSVLSRSGPTTATTQVVSEPSVSTDQEEYAPGQIVQISGSGFAPGQDVTLLVVHIADASALKTSEQALTSFDHSGHTEWRVPVGPDGKFSSSWQVGDDCYGATLFLTADQGDLHADTTFRDAIGFNKGVYNKDDFPPDSTGPWTTGNAGDKYLEGQWVSYQYQVAGIGSGFPTPSFDISFNHYQQNVDALFIDAFANFRACVDCTEDSDTTQGGNDGIGQGMLLDNVPYPSTSTANWKSAISAISLINGTLDADGQCVATEDAVNTPSQEHCFHVDGAALQALFPGTNFSSGNHTITLFYEAHLAASRTWRNGQQYLLGCPTSIHYVAPGPEVIPANTVYGTQAYSGGDPCALDDLGDWTDSISGVGFATGSSRQFNIINQTAGSQGALSLPIPSVQAPTGSITIVKVTVPSPAVGSVFGFDGDLGQFSLDTDPSGANSHTITFNDLPANQAFTVSESLMPSGWDLTNVVCSGAATFSYPTDGATITLNSTSGASATCTFTNTLQTGSLKVVKVTDGGIPNKAYTWGFTPSGFGAPFNLNTTGVDDTDESQVFNDLISGGDYDVAETGIEDGWNLTSSSCTIDGSLVSGPTNITIQPNKLTICTFTNTEDENETRGRIRIDKVTDPAGDDQLFTFTPGGFNGDNTFQLADESDLFDSGLLVPVADGGGPYSIAETVPAGWVLTGATCDDGSLIGAIDVDAGETVTCTFNNSRPDMTISITPEEETNEVGDEHVFTVTVTQDPNGADPATTANITWDVDPTPDSESSTCDSSVDFVGNVATCTITINNNTADTFTANATAVATIDGVELTRTTDGLGGNSGPATKHYVDARISLTPLEATNDVGDPHVITAKVEEDTGSGWVAVENATVNFSLENNTIGATFVGDAFCTTNASGECSVTINANSVGGVDIQATTTIDVNGESITRTTGVEAQNSANAHKDYVSGYITIAEDAVNEVGDAHVFTIVATQLPGNATPATTANITFDVQPGGADVSNTCGAAIPFIGATATCTVTVNSNVVGTVTVNATASFDIEEATVTRTTDGSGNNSDAGVKKYVSGTIQIGPPDETNNIGDPHTFTVTVTQQAGTATPKATSANVVVTFDPDITPTSSTCDADVPFVGDVATCEVTINSDSPGVFTANATATFTVAGVELTRTTDGAGGNSGPAIKRYVAGRIIVRKYTVPAGSTATFDFTASYDDDGFTLQHGGSNNSGFLAPGNYSVNEGAEPGWELTSAICDDGSDPNSIDLAADETVTCDFTNTYLPSIDIDKTGDALSKRGDDVTYTIKVTNTSTAGTGAPSLECDISDPLLGFNKTVTLAPGGEDESSIPFTIPMDADDPFLNTATVSCSYPGSETEVASDSDGHSINLFQPGVNVDKTGDTLSKVGDPVNYTFVVTNTGSADSPDLVNGTIVDTLLGNLLDPANPYVTSSICSSTLATGGSCTITATRTVMAGDPDPLPNTVTVHYNPSGFPNDITDSDDHSVNLFQPSLTITVEGDELSKIGDAVTYTYTITNTSSGDSPDLVLASISDTVVGNLLADATAAGCANLASGAFCTFQVQRAPQAGDPDPLVNTVSVLYNPAGFANAITDDDSHTVNLFQPAVDLEKTGPDFSKAGDTAVYTISILNTSSADSPNLVLDTLTDTLAGDLKQAGIDAGCDNLAPGGTCQFNYNYVVLETDPDPLLNTATVHYHPDGFPNDITDSDTHTTDQLHPAFNVAKVCKAEPVLRAGPAVFTITFNNTGDADLHVVPSEGAPFDVAAGGTYSYDYSVDGPFTANVSNTVTGTVTLDERYELDNSYNFEASDTCDVNGLLIVQKTTIPAGSSQVFSINATGTGAIVGGGAGSISDAADHTYEVAPGTYDVSETVPSGWAQTGNTCDDVVVPAGGSNTCLITNTLLPKLIVRKIVITPQEGVTSEDFTMEVHSTALTPNPTTFPGSETGVTTYFPPGGGSYNVEENADDSDPAVDLGLYQTNYSEDCEGTLAAGETKTCTVTNVYRTGFVTSSSLCTFDVDPTLPGDQFRLIYTPDQSVSVNKLNSSNPGQFFYNVLHYNDGTDSSVTMNIPYPFVTHGATPVHVYTDFDIVQQDGQTCLKPGDAVANYQDTFGLDDFGGSPVMGVTTESVTVNNLPLGVSYINIHLDYGLKKTTGYVKANLGGPDISGGVACANDADQTLLTTPDIYDCQAYTFTNGGTQTVYSINSFKKNPGVGGLNLRGEELPVVGARMELRNARGQLLNTQSTDEDGWYFLNYKHTGKAADFTVTWLGTGLQKKVTLKANGMVQVDFP